MASPSQIKAWIADLLKRIADQQGVVDIQLAIAGTHDQKQLAALKLHKHYLKLEVELRELTLGPKKDSVIDMQHPLVEQVYMSFELHEHIWKGRSGKWYWPEEGLDDEVRVRMQRAFVRWNDSSSRRVVDADEEIGPRGERP